MPTQNKFQTTFNFKLNTFIFEIEWLNTLAKWKSFALQFNQKVNFIFAMHMRQTEMDSLHQKLNCIAELFIVSVAG